MEEKQMETRVMELEKSQIETQTYVKTIQKDIEEIKLNIRELGERLLEEKNHAQNQNSTAWQNVAAELIKLASLSVVILGAIVGAVKLMGQ